MSSQSPPMRVRIHSHVTKTRFLHVGDSLAIGKLRIYAGRYERGQGTSAYCHHFLDLADARVVFEALARAEPGFSYREYKGTPTDGGAISRVLTIQTKGDKVYIELKNGPGKLTPTGAVTPAGPAETEVNVAFKRYEAQRLGAAVLAYLRAWDVIRMLEYSHAAGQPPCYLLVPAGSNGREESQSAQAPAGRNGAAVNTAQAANGPGAKGASGRPVAAAQAGKPDAESRRRPAVSDKPAPNGARRAPPADDTLCYGDGTAVDPANQAERQAFEQYRQAHSRVPASKAHSRAYYQQLAAVQTDA